MLPTLRDYQNKVVSETYAHIRQGKRRVLIVAPTGAGKTHTAAKIVRDAVNVDHQVMFVVHRDALINQTVKSFARWGLSCGVVSGNHKENRFPPVQICSFQSLGRDRDLSWLKPGLVVSDECLTGDSIIHALEGTFRIDDPSIVGKSALSYNETLNIWEYKPVTGQILKGYKQTLIIETKSDKIRCTHNHLIRTSSGWKRADKLKTGDKVLSPSVRVDVEKDATFRSFLSKENQLLGTLRSILATPSITQDLQIQKSPLSVYKAALNLLSKESKRQTQLNLRLWELFTAHFLEILQFLYLIKALEFLGLLLLTDNPKKLGQAINVKSYKKLGLQSRRQKIKDTEKYLFKAKVNVIHNYAKFITLFVQMEEARKSILNGLNKSRTREFLGGIWMMAQLVGKTTNLQQGYTQKAIAQQKLFCSNAGFTLGTELTLKSSNQRKSISSLPSDKKTQHYSCAHSSLMLSPVCSTNFSEIEHISLGTIEPVYDIEVADNHNFVANNLLVHNCHITSFSSIMLQRLPKLSEGRNSNEPVYIGLTATPWRLKRDECLGDIFPVMVKAPSYGQLIRMGNLVQPVYYEVPNSYGKDMAADIHYIIAQWKKWAQNSPTFAFTESIPFAKALAKAFDEEGIRAVAIHEGISAKKRDHFFAEFDQEKIKVLTTCVALVEGVDIPKARVAILARNSDSPSFYFQAVGRVMRPYTYPDGDIKTDCLILDQMGIVSKFGLIEDLEITEADLFNSSHRNKEETGEERKPVKKCPCCEQMVSASCRKCRCGYEFERLDLSDRFLPSGDMQILWKDEAQKVHYAQYQKMLRVACAKNLPFKWADESFLHTYGYFAPSDWRRNAVIPPGNPKMKKAFEEYLQAIAAAESRDPAWISRQLSLELGM